MFNDCFRQRAGNCEPFPYQVRLATNGNILAFLPDVPTGLDKVAAEILARFWRPAS